MATTQTQLVALPDGTQVSLGALKLTLGEAADLDVDGFTRAARDPDGATFRLLELREGPLPTFLEKALAVPGAIGVAARGEHEGRTLLALEPPPGPSLAWVLRRADGLPPWELHLVESLAALFQAIHDAGLLFRRVTPESFGVGKDGTAVLLEPEMLREPTEKPTRARGPFCAPELAETGEADARADLYGLGAIAWCALTNRLLGPREEPTLPRIFQPRLPHGTWTALRRALARAPGQRQPSCRAFADELRARTCPQGRSPSKIALGAASEIGREKGKAMPVNQDAFFTGHDPASGRGLLLVADGVSTADVGSGDLASAMVRDSARAAWEGPIGEILRTHKGPLPQDWPKAALTAILEEANARIYAFLKQPMFVGSLGPSTHPPGSTAILGVLDGDRLILATVGDSRTYLLRGGALEQMSVDQDLKTDLLRAGRDVRSFADPGALGALTRSIGSFFFDHEGGITVRSLEPDITTLQLRAGDRLVICTDGVPDCIGAPEDEKVIARELALGDDAEAIARSLCRIADEAAGADNITALVLLAS